MSGGGVNEWWRAGICHRLLLIVLEFRSGLASGKLHPLSMPSWFAHPSAEQGLIVSAFFTPVVIINYPGCAAWGESHSPWGITVAGIKFAI
jgi:hypothetical protein